VQIDDAEDELDLENQCVIQMTCYVITSLRNTHIVELLISFVIILKPLSRLLASTAESDWK